MGRLIKIIKIACQKFGLRIAERIRGRETSFQLNEREAMNLSPGGTFLRSREGNMVVCGKNLFETLRRRPTKSSVSTVSRYLYYQISNRVVPIDCHVNQHKFPQVARNRDPDQRKSDYSNVR